MMQRLNINDDRTKVFSKQYLKSIFKILLYFIFQNSFSKFFKIRFSTILFFYFENTFKKYLAHHWVDGITVITAAPQCGFWRYVYRVVHGIFDTAISMVPRFYHIVLAHGNDAVHNILTTAFETISFELFFFFLRS